MSLIDIYSDRNEPLGFACEKAEAHAKGLWHRVFMCLVVNPERKTAYLQRKIPGKYIFERPDYLEMTVGGHLEAGERVEDGLREIEEEIGLTPSFSDLIPLGERQTATKIAEKYDNREFQSIFLLPFTGSPSDFRFNDGEVTSLVEVPILEGLDLMRGHLPSLTVEAFYPEDGMKGKNIEIVQKDFVPDYLKTDAILPRLFIAAHRYLKGEDRSFLYW